jgi:hypothetical protein
MSAAYDSRHPEEYEFGRPFDMGPDDGEPEECEHEELDHNVCLHCGKELDPGDVYGGAIDRAMDSIDEQNNNRKGTN